MSRARDLADLGGSANAGTVTGESLIINGDMAVSQRGDVTGASNEYTLDRYKFVKSGTDNLVVDVTQDTDTPDGFSNSMKVDVTTAESAIASDERFSVEQRIEAQNLQHLQYGTSDAKTLTLSFWVKSSVAGKYGINVRHHDASVNKGLDYTINTADTWEYKQISFTGYTTTAINNDNGIGLWFRWMLIVGADFQNTAVENAWNAASNDYYVTTGMQSTWGTDASHNFYLTGVKLEVGTTATPFQHESYADNLLKCQRFFYKADTPMYGQGEYQNGVYANKQPVTLFFPVTMRTAPSVTHSYVNKDNTNSLVTNNLSNAITEHGIRMHTTVGLTAYPYCYYNYQGSFDAEL